MNDYPRITVVTPSLNQAEYLEHTIRSVLDQRYPNLEYIVIDGGSTDGSVDILRRYSRDLAYWVSEPDSGQSDAINKGMTRATGELRAYLNSDDIYLPGALERVAVAYAANRDADLFYGNCRMINERGETIGSRTPDISTFAEVVNVWDVWWNGRNYVQPEVFWTARVAEKVGAFNAGLHMVMDVDYWVRILATGARTVRLNAEIAAFRVTPTQKSVQVQRSNDELLELVRRTVWDRGAPLTTWRRIILQGQWLYQIKFLRTVNASIERGDSRLKRYLSLLSCVALSPKMLLAPNLWRRLYNFIVRRSRRLSSRTAAADERQGS